MADTQTPLSEPAGWAAHDGIPLLKTLASALIVLDDLTELDAFTLPYPPEAQRALDRTVLACLLRGAEPPMSLPDLVSWCRYRPIADWPLNLPADAVAPGDCLLDADSGRPTDLCHEWAERAGDSAVRHRDRLIIHHALERCRRHGEEDAYTAFRRLLVQQPVLTSAEAFEIASDLVLEPVRELISIIYRPVPASFLRDGAYAACGRCRTLLTPVREGSWWCERDRCRRQGPSPVGRLLLPEEAGEVLQLERPLRQFVTGPGRAETELESTLTGLGLTVRMWPGYDAYDLLVTFPDGHRWAVDVKDWAHPAFLGRAACPIPHEPPYDEGFWVVPRHRVREHPAYVAVYERHRPAAARDLPLLTDAALVDRAHRRLRSGHPNTDGDPHA